MLLLKKQKNGRGAFFKSISAESIGALGSRLKGKDAEGHDLPLVYVLVIQLKTV